MHAVIREREGRSHPAGRQPPPVRIVHNSRLQIIETLGQNIYLDPTEGGEELAV